MSVLAFIPARAGSRRIPGKNRKCFAGRPLIAWTLETAAASGLFTEIVVSSDDEDLLQLARKSGARAERRPRELAGDRIRFVEVLVEFLERPAERGKCSAVAVLLPTCPFRSVEDLHEAQRLHDARPDHAVISVTEYEFPPDFACTFDAKSGELLLRQPAVYARSTQSQSVPPAFHPNGSIYWASVERILRTGSYFDGPLIGLPIPPERAIDLDRPHQWPMAEALASHLLKP